MDKNTINNDNDHFRQVNGKKKSFCLNGLEKTNKIIIKNNKKYIELNKPEDFIYDMGDLYVLFDERLNYKEVVGNIPANILENMNAFNNQEILAYVSFLEANLNVFCQGKKPEIQSIDKEEEFFDRCNETHSENVTAFTKVPFDKDMVELQKHKFSLNTSVTGNIKMDLYKENIFMFTCDELHANVKCKRCFAVNALKSGENTTFSCEKCKSSLLFNYIPVFNPDHLGLLQLKNCDLIVFNACNFQISCEKCDMSYFTKKMTVNERFSCKCFKCFTPLRFCVENLRIITGKKVLIKEGSELPEKGTCKHYPKSQRWFRFPCCNSLFPCDVCHDEKTNHTSEYANKMVCGLCSKEQSVKTNCECGMSMFKKHSQFWEGGKGNRNKNTLSKKDSRKNKK
ncbi:hypothetical protein EHP00_21 [Ecytonucleospora hepatopenaei]|uniref:CHY-type domain-containing protein n=1 Tax=Ecytonucleospora hepatopenaei TaxID=646526 RepID=A0A1W0E5I6_9MICR|nr:hypothetical protein EHP00_21 [Ecytonucleospora hepatopenaei]